MARLRLVSIVAILLLSLPALAADRNAYFGDLHIHTAYSMDAFAFATRTTPDDAYRFAAGEAIEHPSGHDIKLDRPLDFYAVTDHAGYLGVLKALADPSHPLANDPQALLYTDRASIKGRGAYLPGATEFQAEHNSPEILRSAWQDIVGAAQRHYRPGTLTTFIAYEYTTSRDGANLHRNVIFKGSRAPEAPFSRLDSTNPEDLWTWMDAQRADGIEALAIPHNSNGSDGWMFQAEQFDGSPLDAAYAEKRMRNEPVVEVTQVKGTSETHPFLSPNDEWADFEIFPYIIGLGFTKSRPRGSYVREAWLNGLAFQSEEGFNPYRFGIIGASDTHNSGFQFQESRYTGKVGVHDYYPQSRGSVPTGTLDGMPTYRDVWRIYYGASGLTGAWAEENNRDAIYDAFRRKETFATTGPRIRVRLFAGADLPADLHTRRDMAEVGYARGVAMGGDLSASLGEPKFVVTALRDALGAPLQRLQIVKGWIEDGQKREQVFDVACSDGQRVDRATHRCPDNGASVDLTTCAISTDVGDDQLATTWTDPAFDAAQEAFYYLRALENPTCRWSTWDAVRAGVAPRASTPATIQERAWSSPIWVQGE